MGESDTMGDVKSSKSNVSNSYSNTKGEEQISNELHQLKNQVNNMFRAESQSDQSQREIQIETPPLDIADNSNLIDFLSSNNQ